MLDAKNILTRLNVLGLQLPQLPNGGIFKQCGRTRICLPSKTISLFTLLANCDQNRVYIDSNRVYALERLSGVLQTKVFTEEERFLSLKF